jgi:hypothetical protein
MVPKVKLTQIETDLSSIVSASVKLSFLHQNDELSDKIDEQTRKAMLWLSRQVAMMVKSLLEIHTVHEDMRLSLAMLGRYPWHGTKITKIKHFELSWFLFQNLCYKFKEKLKLYFNCQKNLSRALRIEAPGWLKAELHLVEKALGPAIRDRGNSVHTWDAKQSHIDWFGTVYFLSSMKKDGAELDLPEGFSDVDGHYRDAKMMLKVEASKMIDDATSVYLRLLNFHGPTPKKCCRNPKSYSML